ncbi:PUA domain-containing protein [Halobaculum sp. MBLA0147]|uniref:PUA domain-containing protein n=1 Tax=Halobaculum sp. MBLA0147 TaxID=3079934 RepID=UPI0035231F17
MTDARDLGQLRTVADYQFGAGAGTALFPTTEAEELDVRRSTGGRPRQVLTPDGERIVSFGTDGRFTLGLAGGRRLQRALDAPANRVVVGDESEPFVRDGKNAFAKFVQSVNDDVRSRDEVLVVHERGALLAVGRAELPASAMREFDSGVAVKVRDAVPAEAADEVDEAADGN